MQKTNTVPRKFDLSYFIATTLCAILIYGGYRWYHSSQLQEPASLAESMNNAHRAYLTGMQFYNEEKYTEASNAFDTALRLNPNHVQARINLTLSHLRLNNVEEALACIQYATSRNTSYAPAYLLLGEIYQRKNNNAQAKEAYEHAITLDSSLNEAHLLLAQLRTREGSAESCKSAIEHAQLVVQRNPTHATALVTLGDAHLMNGENEFARTAYQKALDLAPTNADLLYMIIGKTFERDLNFEKACDYYRKSLAIKDNPQAHVALAGAYFATGKLEEGFKEYEWRWKLSNMQNLSNLWDGSDVKGKRIFVLGENGLGDILQYVRFAQLLKDRGAYVMVHTPKPLIPLLKRCSYIDEIIPVGEAHPQYDFITSMQSIPLYTHVTTKNLPNKPYLTANPQLITEWKTKLAADKKFKIGLCWQPGDDSYLSAHQKRAISLDALAPLACNKNVSFYCIQKNTEQLKNAPFTIHNFGESFDIDHGAFMDTAAIMKNMNLIISVDTSIAHLAGALGVLTWILLPHNPDVRWMINRTDSVWYSNVTLFRQPKPYDWNSVVTHMAQELTKKIR